MRTYGMSIRYWPSDFAKAAQGGCAACSGVQEDVVSGDLRVESTVGRLPGKAVWPQLGCLYRSTDTGSSPFGVGQERRGAAGDQGGGRQRQHQQRQRLRRDGCSCLLHLFGRRLHEPVRGPQQALPEGHGLAAGEERRPLLPVRQRGQGHRGPRPEQQHPLLRLRRQRTLPEGA